MIIKEKKDEFLSYLEDTSNLKGNADTLYVPETSGDVQEVFALCRGKNIPLTCSAGRTGTTGGCVPQGGAILSLEELNRIIDIDVHTCTARVQAGVSLEELSNELEKCGVGLRAQPTESLAYVGGAVSNSASGVRGFKYGGIRNYVKGLEVVLPDSRLLNIKRGEIFAKKRMFDFEKDGIRLKFPVPYYDMPDAKNQAGYYVKDDMDIIDLFIGSEGTLGVITEVELALQRAAEHIFDCVVFFKKEKDSLRFIDTVKEMKRQGKVDPVSLEFFDERSLDFLKSAYPNILNGRAAVYFEQETDTESFDEAIEFWMSLIEKSGVSLDSTWFGDNEKERKRIYEFRHKLPQLINEFLKKYDQRKVSNDIAVPPNAFRDMFRYYEEGGARSNVPYVNFGHIGENHLHFNFLPRNEEESRRARDWSLKFVKMAISKGGTVSAEHGIGKLKRQYLYLMYGAEHIREMARLKHYFDPAFFLGKGNIFDQFFLT